MLWKPHVTVAALVERSGKFLFVEEKTDEGIRFNQPAGHLEDGESLFEAVVRETREETGYDFTPGDLVGVYQWRKPGAPVTYLRFVFAGTVAEERADRALDEGIIAARWLSLDEIGASPERYRSPMVLRCIEDWRAGRRFPLTFIQHCA